eukprot:15447432-Alexandrium_andersonii.AAC.1
MRPAPLLDLPKGARGPPVEGCRFSELFRLCRAACGEARRPSSAPRHGAPPAFWVGPVSAPYRQGMCWLGNVSLAKVSSM